MNSVPGSDGATLSQLASLSMLRQPRTRGGSDRMATGWGGFVAMTLLLAVLPFRADFAIAYAEGPLRRYRPGNEVGSRIEIAPVHGASFGMCGPKKVSTRSRRHKGGTSRMARLMADIDIKRFIRSKRKGISTCTAEVDARPAYLIEHGFNAATPNHTGDWHGPAKATLGRLLSRGGVFTRFYAILAC